MRTRAALILAGLVALGGLPSAEAAPPKPVMLQASSFRFCEDSASYCSPLAPSHTVTVRRGTLVVWTYNDTVCDVVLPCPGHNVAFAGGKPPKVVKGSTLPPAPNRVVLLRKVFPKPGRYPYVCTPHEGNGMTGVVVVTK